MRGLQRSPRIDRSGGTPCCCPAPKTACSDVGAVLQFATARVVAMQGASPVVPCAHALGDTVGEVPRTRQRLKPSDGAMDDAGRVWFAPGSGAIER